MIRSIISVLVFALCLSSGDLDHNRIVNFNDLAIFADNWLQCGDDGGDLTERNDVAAVMIVLTKLEITDQTLELGYKIKNGSDHDVWLCDTLNDLGARFEVYLAEDAQTLVLRRRLDVSLDPRIWWPVPPIGQYIRLPAGAEGAESFSHPVPVEPVLVYTRERANAEYATRLLMEIGFYDDDLPELIRSILKVAEGLPYVSIPIDDGEYDILRRYFKGLLIRNQYRGLSYFDEHYRDSSDEFTTMYTQGRLGEQVLRIAVEDLYIPYEGYIPLTGHGAKRPETGEDILDAAARREKPGRWRRVDVL